MRGIRLRLEYLSPPAPSKPHHPVGPRVTSARQVDGGAYIYSSLQVLAAFPTRPHTRFTPPRATPVASGFMAPLHCSHATPLHMAQPQVMACTATIPLAVDLTRAHRNDSPAHRDPPWIYVRDLQVVD